MVKNITGGSSHKKFARKNQSNTNSNEFHWDKSDPSLIEVSVTKALGDCRFHVVTKDRKELICHISSRYSGKYKHHNLVTVNSLLLTSLRLYENPAKHCDYIHKLNTTTPVDFFNHGIVSDMDLDIFSNKNNETNIQEASTQQEEREEQNNEIDFDSI